MEMYCECKTTDFEFICCKFRVSSIIDFYKDLIDLLQFKIWSCNTDCDCGALLCYKYYYIYFISGSCWLIGFLSGWVEFFKIMFSLYSIALGLVNLN